MSFIYLFLLVPVISSLFVPLLNLKARGVLFLFTIIVNALISSYFAVLALEGQTFEVVLSGNSLTGSIPIRLDALSGWFILVSNLVFITGGIYGLVYMKAYREQKNKLTLHGIVFLMLHTSFTAIFVVQNGFVFLILWEIMALSAFFLVIFEGEKTGVLKAGINYLIQSHVSILFLMLGFMWVALKTGSFDFNAITQFSTTNPETAALLLFLFFFIGFAIKAGFVPFHTWLPYAHPAAPAHISGIMSGVLIKVGIFGILRIIVLIHLNFTTIGYIILAFSIASSLYGVMLAIVQHNLKKLLAYHSIENIGIIGIGIGLGCIGTGIGNTSLTSLGFAGALLHTFNHALFKSLLFYASGIIYQATHILDIEKLGGLIKKLPQTAILFLIAAIAICGIPPFNGFISEFLIYSGLFQWLHNAFLTSLVVGIFSILGLVMVGGLAILCFTKAFGIVFLGTPRHVVHQKVCEAPLIQLLPLYIIAFFIGFIGLFPNLFFRILEKPVWLLLGSLAVEPPVFFGSTFENLQSLTWAMMGLIIMSLIVFFIRAKVTKVRDIKYNKTWGCGYANETPKLQYTASSFTRSYAKFFSTILHTKKKTTETVTLFPKTGHFETSTYDKLENWLIDKPLIVIKSFMGKFAFLQNGKLQYSILYGIVFIISIIGIPLLIEKIELLIEYLKQLH